MVSESYVVTCMIKKETNQLSHKVSLQMHKDSIKNLFFSSLSSRTVFTISCMNWTNSLQFKWWKKMNFTCAHVSHTQFINSYYIWIFFGTFLCFFVSWVLLICILGYGGMMIVLDGIDALYFNKLLWLAIFGRDFKLIL